MLNSEQNIIDSSQEINHEQYLLIIKNSFGGRKSANLLLFINQEHSSKIREKQTSVCVPGCGASLQWESYSAGDHTGGNTRDIRHTQQVRNTTLQV
jgi:hypothetical protein